MPQSPNEPPEPIHVGVPPTEADLAELARSPAATRGLAWALLRGDSLAEDAHQDVLLSALERPPHIERGWVGWFRAAVRRRTLHLARHEGLRVERQGIVAPEEHVARGDAPSDAVSREELRERLIAEVMALSQPYRTPIYLRYFEQLDVQQIAEHLERPVSTVQTQLQRGLAMLRTRLAASSDNEGGDWAQWMASLLGPIGITPMGVGPGAGALQDTGASVLPSEVGVGSMVLKGAGVALLGMTALLTWRAVHQDSVSDTGDGTGSSTQIVPGTRSPDNGTRALSEATRSTSERTPPTTTSPLTEMPGPEASPPLGMAFDLLVLAETDGRPLASAKAMLFVSSNPALTGAPTPDELASALSAGKDGAIQLSGQAGAWVRIAAPGFVSSTIALPAAPMPLRVYLPAAHELRVHVPVSWAAVEVVAWRVERYPLDVPPIKLVPATPGTSPNSSGAVYMAQLAPGQYLVRARQSRGPWADGALLDLRHSEIVTWSALDSSEPDLEVHFSGVVAPELPLTGLLLTEGAEQIIRERRSLGGAPLVFPSMQPGDYQLLVSTPSGDIERLPITVEHGQGAQRVALELHPGSLHVEIESQLPGSAETEVYLIGPLGQRPTLHQAIGWATDFAALRPGRYELWARSPGSIDTLSLQIADQPQRVNLVIGQGALAQLTYSGAPPLARHEVVLVTPSGVKLSLLHGLEFGSASVLGSSPGVVDPQSTHGSLGISLPAGTYRVLVSFDDFVAPAQTFAVGVGEHVEIHAPRSVPTCQLQLMRAGRVVAHEVVELAGHPPGVGPYSVAPGTLWMLQRVTDAQGRIELPVVVGECSVTCSGGSLKTFVLKADTRHLTLDLAATPD